MRIGRLTAGLASSAIKEPLLFMLYVTYSASFLGRRGGIIMILLSLAFLLPFLSRAATPSTLTPGERDQLTQQLAQLEKEAADLDKNIQQTQSEARTLKNEIRLFNDEIKRKEVEIQRLKLVIRQAQVDIDRKVSNIKVTSSKIGVSQKEIGALVQELSRQDKSSLLEVLLKDESLSEFFLSLNNLERIQGSIHDKLIDLRDYKSALEKEKAELEDFRAGQEDLRSIRQSEEKALASEKTERDQLLKLTQGKESLFQEILKKKQTDIAAIRNQLFYLQKAGITAEEALKYAKLASGRTGIRPAFLLALLEVETGKQFENGQITVGSNLGTGNWLTDMYQCYINLGKPSAAEAQKAAFFNITTSLGLNPDTTPVSRKPNYGCGGAMGPAQFIPTTWLLFDDKVASLTGRSPANPWEVDDAFTGAAIFLADAGAKSQTKSGEIAAARTYISGNRNCPGSGSARYACISYGNRVYSLSQEIDRAI